MRSLELAFLERNLVSEQPTEAGARLCGVRSLLFRSIIAGCIVGTAGILEYARTVNARSAHMERSRDDADPTIIAAIDESLDVCLGQAETSLKELVQNAATIEGAKDCLTSLHATAKSFFSTLTPEQQDTPASAAADRGDANAPVPQAPTIWIPTVEEVLAFSKTSTDTAAATDTLMSIAAQRPEYMRYILCSARAKLDRRACGPAVSAMLPNADAFERNRKFYVALAQEYLKHRGEEVRPLLTLKKPMETQSVVMNTESEP